MVEMNVRQENRVQFVHRSAVRAKLFPQGFQGRAGTRIHNRAVTVRFQQGGADRFRLPHPIIVECRNGVHRIPRFIAFRKSSVSQDAANEIVCKKWLFWNTLLRGVPCQFLNFLNNNGIARCARAPCGIALTAGRPATCPAVFAHAGHWKADARIARNPKTVLRRKYMRNWCLAAALSVFLASPLCAQHKTGDDSSSATETGRAKPSGAASNAVAIDQLAFPRHLFAVPAAPRPKPLPGPKAKDTRAPGQLVPGYEFGVTYDYINFRPGSPFADFSNHGAAGSFTYNASRWLGLTAELGAYRFKNRIVNGTPVNGSIVSSLFGPRLNLRKFDYFVPFAEFLLGGSRGGTAVIGVGSENSFTVVTGGGVDMVLNKNWAWHVAQLDYLMTNFSGPTVGGNARQDNFRAGTGIVYRWEIPSPPPPPNHPPVAACSVNPTSIYAGSGDTVVVHVNASDPDNDPLTYSHSATSGTVEGTGPDARWNSTGVGAGSYTVNVKVDDGKGGRASCSADIKVEEKSPTIRRPPTSRSSAARFSPAGARESPAMTATGQRSFDLQLHD